MKTIWKYKLNEALLHQAHGQKISLPYASNILTVQEQNNELCLWAMVDPDEVRKVQRTICIHGTGHPVPNGANKVHITTFQKMGGQLVWHVFEEMPVVES